MSENEMEAPPESNGGDHTNGLTNGITNGNSGPTQEITKEHKHHHRDKERDKHRDKDRHSSSHKSSHRDKDRHSSSHKSSHRDKDKDKERSSDKSRERSDKDKERSDKHKERSDKDKERHKDRDRKDKDRSDKDKDRSKDKDRHKDKEHRDKDRSDKDKDRHKDKDKERHRDKDKDRHSSSSGKDKHRSRDDKDRKSSSSGDKKDRHHSSHKSSHRDREKDKHRSKSKDEEKVKIKLEPEVLETSMEMTLNTTSESIFNSSYREEQSQIKEESMESEEEDKLVISEPVAVKEEYPESMEEEDVPLFERKQIKEEDGDLEEDVPLLSRKKVKKEKKRKKNYEDGEEDDDDDFKPEKKKVKKERIRPKKGKPVKQEKKYMPHFANESPTKKAKKEDDADVWKWWEEEKKDDGVKWKSLEHKGPVFPETYDRIPSKVKFLYEGKHIVLSDETEEVAGFYARMLEHDYTTKEVFNKNFFKDWRSVMNEKERKLIVSLPECDFRPMFSYFTQLSEDRKNKTKEQKKALRLKNESILAEYGWCVIDGHRQKIGNFKIEPPGLFRGRGEHPKQGRLKRRLRPEQVIINCGKGSNVPQPPEGHRWKEVRHDQGVTWLSCWVENIQAQTKYIMLNAASKLKGEKDWQKYETARKLHKTIDKIRTQYYADFKSKEMRIRQRAVALYFIDKLALRAGNEKDDDQADTVGCCSLRVEHIKLHDVLNDKEYVVVFDFLGKDSIRYYNEVDVEKRVYKNLTMFMDNKNTGDDLFDRLNTAILNKHLNELMEGLTAKVFRTYNASRTLQEQLLKLTEPDDPIPLRVLAYNRANREVAILCNHQRAVPKTHDKSMLNLQTKIDEKKVAIEEAEKSLRNLKRQANQGGSVKERTNYDKKRKTVERLKEQLHKLEISATDKEENKQIALGTSKLNYLDPRISVAWCKKFEVPIEKVYNKTQRQKFQWAIDMATSDYNFMDMDTLEVSRHSQADDDDEEEEYEE